MKSGMIISGVAASEALDSSGEVVAISGVDISTTVGGRVNYEHLQSDERKEGTAPGEEVVGKIVYVKKINKLDDCDTEDQTRYWEELEIPYIYVVCRLYDQAGHRAARALAASIRDAHDNGEKSTLRFSIEGSTIKKENGVIEKCIFKDLALTYVPCNRTADLQLLADPDAPKNFTDPGTSHKGSLKDIIDSLDKSEFTGGPKVTNFRANSYRVVDASQLPPDVAHKLKTIVKIKALTTLHKTLTAGNYNVAPGNLSGGAVLQREGLPLRDRIKKVITEYKPKDGKFDKAEFQAVIKAQLPEVSPKFLDYFSEVARDHHIKLKKALNLEGDHEVKPQEGLKWEPAPKKPAPAAPPPSHEPQSSFKGAPVGKEAKNRISMDPEGGLTTSMGDKLTMHIPDGPEYLSILHPDMYDIPDEKKALYKSTVHEPWEKAMSSWMELNKRAREGRIPKSIVHLAGLFSSMSPNTGVALQERHYGHVMDMLHEGVLDLSKPVEQSHVDEFTRRATGPELPRWNREHYEVAGPQPGVADWQEAADVQGELNDFGNPKAELPQINGLKHLHEIMPHLEHLFATHGADGRTMASVLMSMKSAYKRKVGAKDAEGNRLGAAKAKEQLGHPNVAGFGPKLNRYMLSMAGAGNIIVPDRHMTRSLYNVAADDPMADYLATKFVTQAKNEPYLAALDQQFFHKHPAVRHVLNKYPEHFKGHEEQAIFPAFWLHWLHIPHYEVNQGRSTEATIGGTDHKVFWDSIQESMKKHGIPIKGQEYNYEPEDTSFDFGHNVQKSEQKPMINRLAAAMTEIGAKHGEMGVLSAFYAHIVPQLLKKEKPGHVDHQAFIRKAQMLTIDLRKSADDLMEAQNMASALKRTSFAGHHVVPGMAEIDDQPYSILHEDQEHYYAVPAGVKQADFVSKLVKLPKNKEGSHYTVHQKPSVLVTDL